MTTPQVLNVNRMAYDTGQFGAGAPYRFLHLYRQVVTDATALTGTSNRKAGELQPAATEIGHRSFAVQGVVVPPWIEEQKCSGVFVGYEHAELLIHLPRAWSFSGYAGGYDVSDLVPASGSECWYTLTNALTGVTQTYRRSHVHEYSAIEIQITLGTVN